MIHVIHRRAMAACVSALLALPALEPAHAADAVDARAPPGRAVDAGKSLPLSVEAGDEFRLAQADHVLIAAELDSCLLPGGTFQRHFIEYIRLDPLLRDNMQIVLSTPSYPSTVLADAAGAGASPRPPRATDGSGSSAPDLGDVDSFSTAVIYLSHAVAQKRAQVAAAATGAYSRMLEFQWLIVVFGAVTTILVSLKSMTDPPIGKWSTWIGVGAVVFSTLGTATATLDSVYQVRGEYAKDRHLLNSLRRLHNDMAVTVALRPRHDNRCTRIEEVNDAHYTIDAQELQKHLRDWATNFQVLINPESGDTGPAEKEPGQS